MMSYSFIQLSGNFLTRTNALLPLGSFIYLFYCVTEAFSWTRIKESVRSKKKKKKDRKCVKKIARVGVLSRRG